VLFKSLFFLHVLVTIFLLYEMAEQALMLDPLTSVCSLEEIRQIFAELYEKKREYLPELEK